MWELPGSYGRLFPEHFAGDDRARDSQVYLISGWKWVGQVGIIAMPNCMANKFQMLFSLQLLISWVSGLETLSVEVTGAVSLLNTRPVPRRVYVCVCGQVCMCARVCL